MDRLDIDVIKPNMGKMRKDFFTLNCCFFDSVVFLIDFFYTFAFLFEKTIFI